MTSVELTILGVFLLVFKAMALAGIKAHWDLVYKIVPDKFSNLEKSLVTANSETVVLQRETIKELQSLRKGLKKFRKEARPKPGKFIRRREPAEQLERNAITPDFPS